MSIVMLIKGGLGNQMFQYAYARSLCLRTGQTLKLDLTSFPWSRSRHYSLDRFRIQATVADRQEIAEAIRKHRVCEDGMAFQERYLTLRDCYVDGYFQSPKYFADRESLIRSEFTLREPLSEKASVLVSEMENTESVSFSVRRGDYVKGFRGIYRQCGPEYYREAMNVVRSWVENPHYFVFSDDAEWVREAIRFPEGSVTYVSRAYETNPSDGNAINPTDYEDLAVMARCCNHIIGNSTFAWWGAWLSGSDRVVAPGRWFADDPDRNRDLLPDRWVKL